MRREAYVPFGGPDGGDGGRGGHVILRADTGLTTLTELRHRSHWRAEDGGHGGASQKTGAQGEDLLIAVPVGTLVYNAETDDLICDLTAPGQERIVAAGGQGGLGNPHFKSSTNRSPRTTTPGGPGQTLRLRLELKLMADVGLLGFPNAGKSTFISVISAARPKVADYPFTTLVPHLGVVSMGHDGSFVVADIPGIIEGAAEGKGLGHQFLRHVERTRMLLHLLSLAELADPDADPTSPDDTPDADRALSPAQRYEILRNELENYDIALLDRPEIVVLTQADVATPEQIEAARAELAELGVTDVHVISAVTGQGVTDLVQRIWTLLRELRDAAVDADRV